MPVNAFLVQGNMIKHKTLPFYETCILNYDIRRRSNPAKVKEFMFEQGTIRPIMHAGNLWDKVKNFFKKGKNAVTKTMDFIDNSPVLKGFKDSALNYIGQKTGVDVNKIYDTTHQIMDSLPTYNTEPDPVDYFNQRQQYYGTTYDTYGQPGNPYSYNNQNYTSYNTYNQPAMTSRQNYTVPNYGSQTGTFQNQLTNAYNQIQNQPLTQPQKETVKRNFNLFANGLKSCGSDIMTALNMNKTLGKNIPKLLMMGVNPASGKISIDKSFKPILEKLGHHSLIVPKTIKNVLDKLKIPVNSLPSHDELKTTLRDALKRQATMATPNAMPGQLPNRAIAKTIGKQLPGSRADLMGKGDSELATGRLNLGRGNNLERVNTSKSSNQLSSTNNNSPTRAKPSSLPSTGKSSAAKQSRYADILAKLSK